MKARFLLAAVALVVLGLVAAPMAGAAPQSLAITNPASDVAFGAANDYSTLVWDHPLDMSDPLDVRQTDSPAVVPQDFSPFSCTPGLWCAHANDNNPNLFLLMAGYAGALHVGRDGNLRPINASVYTRLTFRMYLDVVPQNAIGWQVMWTNGTVGDFGGSLTKYGQTVFFPLVQGWAIYSVDLTGQPLSGIPWAGNLTGLRLDVGNNNMTGRTVELDWARLTGPNGDNRTVNWSAQNESGNVGINFISSDGVSTPYADTYIYTDPSTHNRVGRFVTVSVNARTYSFHGSLPADTWRINLHTSNDSATSNGRWLIHAAPTLSFVKPSYTSGADYASTVLGNPWDMNNEGDVASFVNAHNHTYSNGVFSAENTGPQISDPQLWMLHEPLAPQYNIDTSRFRYVTFSLSVDGPLDISQGYITRLFWFVEPNRTSCGETNDIPLHAGWNVVSLDLWTNILDDQAGTCNNLWRSAPARNQLRLDPDEIFQSYFFHLDYVLLTAMDTARSGASFPIEYQLGVPGDGVTFYYSTGRNTTDRIRLNGSGQAASPAGFNFRVFFPLIMGQPAVVPPPGAQVFNWNLAGVNPNTYYISADVTDGFNTVSWFSDTPVVITP